MSDYLQIYEGWRNKLIPPAHLKDIIEETAKERMEICNGCELSLLMPRITKP
jgi:hypothetical protein